MKRWATVMGIAFMGCGLAAGATLTRYVSTKGTHTSPFTSWETAATNIITAVHWANTNNAGDTVWISNGPHQVSATITIGNTKVRGVTGDYRDVVVHGTGNVMGTACFKMTKADSELSAVTLSNFIGTTAGAAVSMNPTTVGPAGLLSNCLIAACSGDRGPAIYFQCSNAVVANCVIENNTSKGYGTIYSEGPTTCYGPLICNTLIRNNIAVSNTAGGAIRINTPGAVLRNTTFQGNTATSGGGAIYTVFNFTADRCLIASNVTQSTYGGGVYVNGPQDVVLSNCHIVGNYAANSGGGLSMRPGGARLYNCLIARNTSTAGLGGGIFCNALTTALYNCTVVLNSVSGQNTGGGLYGDGTGRAYVYNSILYSNWLGTASVNSNYNTTGSGHVFSNCCAAPLPTNGTDNMADTPGLRDMAAGQYEPVAGSPCIGKGLNQEWMNGALDWLGRERLDRFTRRVDIGACEYVYPGALMSLR